MKKFFLGLLAILFTLNTIAQNNNNIDLNGEWKFKKGDNPQWAKRDLKTSGWDEITVPHWDWAPGYDGYGWLRKEFVLPRKEAYFFNLGQVDDECSVYFNGKLLDLYTGTDADKISSDTTEWKKYRCYYIPGNLVKANAKNTLAIKILDNEDQGGIRYGNVFVSNTVFYNSLPLQLEGNWLKTDGSNDWIIGFYNNKVAYKNRIWNYGTITKERNFYKIALSDKNVSEELFVKEEKSSGKYWIGSDTTALQLCSKSETYIAADKTPNIPAFKSHLNDTLGIAVFHGYIKGYMPGKSRFALVKVEGSGKNKAVERRIEINPDGTFLTHIPIRGAAIADIRFPGKDESSPSIIQAGKVTMLVIDLEEYKIRFDDEYDSRDRLTKFMGEKAAENKLNQYISSLDAGFNEDIWKRFIYASEQYIIRGNSYGTQVNSIAQFIAENYSKANDAESLKKARLWVNQLLLSSPDNHKFNSTYSIILQKLGERMEGLQYLAKAFDLAEKERDQNFSEKYKYQVKKYVEEILKEPKP